MRARGRHHQARHRAREDLGALAAAVGSLEFLEDERAIALALSLRTEILIIEMKDRGSRVDSVQE